MTLKSERNPWLLEGCIEDDVRRSLKRLNAQLEGVPAEDTQHRKPLEEARTLLRYSRMALETARDCRHPKNRNDPRCFPPPTSMAARATFEKDIGAKLAELEPEIANVSRQVDTTICAECSPDEAKEVAKNIAELAGKVAGLRVKDLA